MDHPPINLSDRPSIQRGVIASQRGLRASCRGLRASWRGLGGQPKGCVGQLRVDGRTEGRPDGIAPHSVLGPLLKKDVKT